MLVLCWRLTVVFSLFLVFSLEEARVCLVVYRDVSTCR